ncbi:hypothetical protein AUEXF2481DRAFT_44263 [Aureobasidium subglaciale EXF-2481]|uniref:Uncharacterized protein n=1 Tax=Aureobasidium subglaciale (strain EXF-2481) TaxID=1043005 RepID=A0A074YAT4_AURSE|nr:uncharacterized protein AUEXF2481DRAFT_44263 [Aureobasidium subglaciale EXF-2481]KEQ91267.1 hypothetical protein AUEXF2481DRAFT_44263 [Aureobasidium subglaciale EXF-2481]
MAPRPQDMPLPLLGLGLTAPDPSNTSYDSPGWEWARDEGILSGAYVPYICEAILVILVFT